MVAIRAKWAPYSHIRRHIKKLAISISFQNICRRRNKPHDGWASVECRYLPRATLRYLISGTTPPCLIEWHILTIPYAPLPTVTGLKMLPTMLVWFPGTLILFIYLFIDWFTLCRRYWEKSNVVISVTSYITQSSRPCSTGGGG